MRLELDPQSCCLSCFCTAEPQSAAPELFYRAKEQTVRPTQAEWDVVQVLTEQSNVLDLIQHLERIFEGGLHGMGRLHPSCLQGSHIKRFLIGWRLCIGPTYSSFSQAAPNHRLCNSPLRLLLIVSRHVRLKYVLAWPRLKSIRLAKPCLHRFVCLL